MSRRSRFESGAHFDRIVGVVGMGIPARRGVGHAVATVAVFDKVDTVDIGDTTSGSLALEPELSPVGVGADEGLNVVVDL